MEEKKLTDEEVIKELINESNRGEWCGLTFIDCVEVRVLKNAIDLIHRLQKENKELKSPKFASWKLKFFNLKEEFDKELSEHEEFTKKAKAEIERLTEERDMYADDLYWKAEVRKREDFISELTVENAELQKQVDYWRTETIETRNDKAKSVKDTAKEIYGLAVQYYNGYETDMERFILLVKERYGVEVE